MGKRRKFTSAFKAKVAVAAIKGHKTVNEIATEFGVHPNQVTAWKKQLLESAEDAFSKKNQICEKDVEAEKKHTRRLVSARAKLGPGVAQLGDPHPGETHCSCTQIS